MHGSIGGPQIQADEHALGIGQIADDLAHRCGKFAHQGWDCQDLIALRQLRMFEQIDDLDLILAGQVLVAKFFEIGEGGQALGRLPGNIEAQLPDFTLGLNA